MNKLLPDCVFISSLSLASAKKIDSALNELAESIVYCRLGERRPAYYIGT